jgi:hypothetical protein
MRSTQILTLWCRGRSYAEIVEIVGCRREYVRAIISRSRLQLNPEWQARTREYKRAWRARKMMAPRLGGARALITLNATRTRQTGQSETH